MPCRANMQGPKHRFKIKRLEATVLGVKIEVKEIKDQLQDTVQRSLMVKVNGMMTRVCQRM